MSKKSRIDFIAGVDRDLDEPNITPENKKYLTLPNVKGSIIIFETTDTEKDFQKELWEKDKSWDCIPIKWEDDTPRYFSGIDPINDEHGSLNPVIQVLKVIKRPRQTGASEFNSRALLMEFLPPYLKWNGNTLPAIIRKTIINEILERL